MAARRVDARLEHNPSPEYSRTLFTVLEKKGMTHGEIATRIGLTRRQVLNLKRDGFGKYPPQYIMESLVRNTI